VDHCWEIAGMKFVRQKSLFLLLLVILVATQIVVAQRHVNLRSADRGDPFFATSGNSQLSVQQSSFFDSAQTEWVRYYSSASMKANAGGTAITVDQQGFIYAAGKIESPYTSYDFWTAKYNANGVKLWEARYDGPAHGFDIANAIAVDGIGNVYVTGLSGGIGTGADFATVKYNSSGQEQWVARYDGPRNAADAASEIAVDNDGNVFVCGESTTSIQDSSKQFDCTTIKYNSIGVEQWVNRYDGLAHRSDLVAGLEVDASGNAYMVSASYDSLYAYFSTTIVKYSPDGRQQWLYRYRPPGATSAYPLDACADDSGSVIVTGYARLPSSKCFTIKVDTSGMLMWSTVFQEPYGMSNGGERSLTDGNGNVYVLGAINYYNPGFDSWSDSLLLLKYDRNGQLSSWSSFRIELPTRQGLINLAIGDDNSIFITSTTTYGPSKYITVKFSPVGSEEWRTSFDAYMTGLYHSRITPAVIAASNFGLNLVGATGGTGGTDIVMLKYTPSGTQTWVDTVESARSWDQVYAISTDDSGNVIVMGSSESGIGESDLLTIKYNPAGETQWIARYSNPDNMWIMPSAMKTDQAGNVYIVATRDSTDRYRPHLMTVKYNVSGELQWTAVRRTQFQYTGLHAIDIDVSRQGDVFISGVYNPGRPSSAYLTVKYDQSGVEQWAVTHDTPNGNGPTSIAVDDSNNVIVAGTTDVVKYDQNGNEQWVYPGPATAVVVDHSGSVFLTDEAGPTTMLRETGSIVWSTNFGGNAIVLDPQGGAFVRNYAGGIGKINNAGVKVWGFETGESYGSDLAVDTDGNVYTAGLHFGSGFSQYQIRSYTSSGVKRWTKSLDGNGATAWYQFPLALSKDGESIHLGANESFGASSVLKTIKYRQVATSIRAIGGDVPNEYSLGQNYPNPFNPSTTIEFSIPSTDLVTLKIYNLLGEEIATLVNEQKAPGAYRVEWNAGGLASGLYFYTLRANTFAQTRKLMLIK